MNALRKLKCLALITLVFLTTESLFACATCYGKSDSSLAVGMNWGIFTLLVIVGSVLGGISAFFIFLAKRSAMVSAANAMSTGGEAIDKV